MIVLNRGYRGVARAVVNRIVAGVLLAIVSVYYINSTMFSHAHLIEGATIIHSHFHSDSHTEDSEDGGHTQGELTLIQHLNNITLLRSESTFSSKVYLEREYFIYVPSTLDAVECEPQSLRSPRAPPIFFV